MSFFFVLLLSFAGSLASVLTMRGGYFFSHEIFQFSTRDNLWLALGGGIAYVAGALPSHRLAVRFGERRLLLASMVLQAACLVGMIAGDGPAIFVACQLVFQLANGLMWPVVESYVSAGRSPLETARALGRFNVTWSSTVPVGVMLSGPIIEHGGTWLFGAALICFVVTIAATMMLPARPVHLSHDAPERLNPTHSLRYQRLLRSSRWLLLFGYTIFFLLPPLMPQLFADMGHDVKTATAVASAIEWARFATFTAMYLTTRWHNRAGVLALCIVLLPMTFVGILLNATVFDSTVMVVLFSLAFGVVECLIYYAALYYGMVVLNASVDAGGAHEGLIGLGYTLGPAAALVGQQFVHVSPMFKQPWGELAALVPMAVVFIIGAARPLWQLRRKT